MLEKELIIKLKKLQNLKPDQQWKTANREILYSQISNSINTDNDFAESSVNNLINVITLPRRIYKLITQPAWVVVIITLVVVGGSVFSVRAARFTKPGDSLYIARVISEKAQLAITFNVDEKAKLNIKFSNNHAKDITQVLADPDFNNEDNKVKAEKLAQDFKKEINSVKTKLKEMNLAEKSSNLSGPKPGASEENENNEEAQVFSANLGKEDKGMQISEPAEGADIAEQDKKETDSPEVAQEEIATSTSEAEKENDTNNLQNAHQILEEAEKLFNEKDYNGTLDQLEKVGAIIEGADNSSDEGEVKGISEKTIDNIIGEENNNVNSEEAASTTEERQ